MRWGSATSRKRERVRQTRETAGGIVRAWCRVSGNERVAEDTHWLEIEAGPIGDRAVPGQFVMVGFGLSAWGTSFLPRPNSIAAVREGRLGLLIRVYGRGSRRLAGLRPGDEVLLLGPLGRAFQLGDARRVVCVAGGVGLAPFLLMPRWAESNAEGTEIRLLYGERDARAVFDPAKIAEISGIRAEIWTEDGSLGRHGLVTQGIEPHEADLILACGPPPMLRAVSGLALETGVPCQLAVEEHMACGVGTCIGCAIETRDPETDEEGFSLVCTDGPVFAAERLRW